MHKDVTFQMSAGKTVIVTGKTDEFVFEFIRSRHEGTAFTVI